MLTLADERALETELDLALELAGVMLEATAPMQTAPAIIGTCALLPPFVPCTPNSTLEPTAL
jgi:hypothetical protein